MPAPLNAQIPTASNCLICQAPLPFNPARTSPLCAREACRQRYSLLQRQGQVCRVCGRPLSARERPTQTCATAECQRAEVKDYAVQVYERNQARHTALLRQEIECAARLRDRVLTTFGIREPDSFPLVVIPAVTAGLVRLPEPRRQAFREHLMVLVEQVFDPSEALAEPPERAPALSLPPGQEPRVRAVLEQTCARCQGFCCQGGGDHAYLSVETLRAYRATHPKQDSSAVTAAYLDRVGSQTYQGSCIYHQADGCALSREMRPDLCNRFFCKALLEFQRDLPVSGPVRGFFVTADYGELHTATLVHESHALIVSNAGRELSPPAAEIDNDAV